MKKPQLLIRYEARMFLAIDKHSSERHELVYMVTEVKGRKCSVY